ncbi:hypothetical protein FA13DRAFT_1781399 [Coprinellus micaceus]|uniref:Uncharacterized protein n=1 Tax=Coprinellus micaceus TaxID=71717 RepID=A0A4Y7SB58_COPMI|nr:hypothetical protein FA13DRAFT_1781399 [Coprinellus micaceus]
MDGVALTTHPHSGPSHEWAMDHGVIALSTWSSVALLAATNGMGSMHWVRIARRGKINNLNLRHERYTPHRTLGLGDSSGLAFTIILERTTVNIREFQGHHDVFFAQQESSTIACFGNLPLVLEKAIVDRIEHENNGASGEVIGTDSKDEDGDGAGGEEKATCHEVIDLFVGVEGPAVEWGGDQEVLHLAEHLRSF